MIRYNLTICSYCFDVHALAVINNTLLAGSCALRSRKFPTKPSVHAYKFFKLIRYKLSLKYQARKLADLSARGIAILLSTSIPLLVLTNSSLLFDIEPINIFRYRVCNPRYMSIWDFVVNYPDP